METSESINCGVKFFVATTNAPGAVGIVQIFGERKSAANVMMELVGCEVEEISKVVQISDIDEGLAVRIGKGCYEVMPHGGTRVMQRVVAALEGLGAIEIGEGEIHQNILDVFPEATCEMEGQTLATIGRTASGTGVERLLGETERWRNWLAKDLGHEARRDEGKAILKEAAILEKLIKPPTVVLVGKANVGKSTLANLVKGRPSSITADLRGTTRDWVGGLAQFSVEMGEIAVRLVDTPGIWESRDEIEVQAIEIAREVIGDSDMVVGVRDWESGWMDEELIGRRIDLWVLNKVDLRAEEISLKDSGGRRVVRMSALEGEGMDGFAEAVVEALGLSSVGGNEVELPWAFCEPLRELIRNEDWREIENWLISNIDAD